MIRSQLEQRPLDAAIADAAAATLEFDRARAWFRTASAGALQPLGAEVWVLDPALEQIVLVDHPVRGLVPPGGRVEPGECPRDGAARELAEEPGLRPQVLERPARSGGAVSPPKLAGDAVAVLRGHRGPGTAAHRGSRTARQGDPAGTGLAQLLPR